ncbi:SseB family protein [Pantoea agglomerans]|uniref:SseB family protein n=1 Tax=Enterobacter agglomerans TaxID=549 RepID=UPI002793F704|nr:SseB family protein [Pantoea agglomerans]MDQ0550850.1 hypothetical protein [Pantoea agglomerans]
MSDEKAIKLETALKLAADHPAERPEFYRVLLDSSLYVLGSSGGATGDGEVELKAGENISIQHWEKPDGQAVDLMRLGQNDKGLDSHIRSQFTPFYVRSMKQKLKGMFGR